MTELTRASLHLLPSLVVEVGAAAIFLIATFPCLLHSQSEPLPSFTIATVDFFSIGTADLDQVRQGLPIHPGDTLSESQIDAVLKAIRTRPLTSIGHPPSDVALVCCDEKKQWAFYVGLGMNRTGDAVRSPRPSGNIRLPRRVIDLYRDEGEASAAANEDGNASQDDSKGYSLTRDPATCALQLQMRSYAIEHGSLLRRVLRDSSSSTERMVAAQLLGYGLSSKAQIAALARAARDRDSEVRNNATRALWVMSNASPELARSIPSDSFVGLLNSGAWSDRNKSSLLLAGLTASRNPALLNLIECEALPSLIEMARWRSKGHAFASAVMLGRIAGMSEEQISSLIGAGKIEQVIAAVPAPAATPGRRRSCLIRVPSPPA